MPKVLKNSRSDEFLRLIFEILKSGKMSLRELSKTLGINENNIYAYKMKYNYPSVARAERHLKMLYKINGELNEEKNEAETERIRVNIGGNGEVLKAIIPTTPDQKVIFDLADKLVKEEEIIKEKTRQSDDLLMEISEHQNTAESLKKTIEVLRNVYSKKEAV
jgi:transcriptional regulator with XRE-family HTH domain